MSILVCFSLILATIHTFYGITAKTKPLTIDFPSKYTYNKQDVMTQTSIQKTCEETYLGRVFSTWTFILYNFFQTKLEINTRGGWGKRGGAYPFCLIQVFYLNFTVT